MLHHALFGFLRVSLVGGCNKVVPEKLFRRRIFRDTPSIRSSVPVLHIDKIRDADIALHLQSRDARLKTGVLEHCPKSSHKLCDLLSPAHNQSERH